jgi:hypothetical protein
MQDNKMTVTLWAEITEIDENQSENLNGGNGHFNLYIAGGIGSVQQNGNDGLQVNVLSKGYAPRGCGYHRPYYRC